MYSIDTDREHTTSSWLGFKHSTPVEQKVDARTIFSLHKFILNLTLMEISAYRITLKLLLSGTNQHLAIRIASYSRKQSMTVWLAIPGVQVWCTNHSARPLQPLYPQIQNFYPIARIAVYFTKLNWRNTEERQTFLQSNHL